MRIVRLAAAALLLLFAAAPAAAQNVPIKAFFGEYSGTAVAKNRDSLYFGVTVRDLDVKIGPSAAQGFTIVWTTVTRRGGTPRNPKVKRKTTTMSFVPAGRPGVYRANLSGDLLSGKVYAWARLRRQTLTVYAIGIAADGRYEVSKYQRRLVPGGMRLTFTRDRDGQRIRAVTGRLTREK